MELKTNKIIENERQEGVFHKSVRSSVSCSSVELAQWWKRDELTVSQKDAKALGSVVLTWDTGTFRT